MESPMATMVIEGATDRIVFTTYVREVLLPQLRPGDVVILDNRSAHHGPAVAALIAGAQAELWFLPPDSPDLNPIEKMWSKLKALLRTVQARGTVALRRAIAKALNAITPHDAAA
jgi:transposase